MSELVSGVWLKALIVCCAAVFALSSLAAALFVLRRRAGEKHAAEALTASQLQPRPEGDEGMEETASLEREPTRENEAFEVEYEITYTHTEERIQ